MRRKVGDAGNLIEADFFCEIIQDILVNSIQSLCLRQTVLKSQTFTANRFSFTRICDCIEYL